MSNAIMENQSKRIKKPWPTKDAMEQIYQKKLWGDNHATFYSGIGSHHPDIVGPYVDAVSSFLTSLKKPIVVCDLGCGDFNIGQKLVKYTKKYIAIDIVSELIAYNKKKYSQENLEFYCLDIAEKKLPKGDCVILRQVLQHLSNTEVQKIVKKLTSFKYIIITEHLPQGDFVANKDIISGQGIRLKKQSGICLTLAPFNLKIEKEKKLVSSTIPEHKGVITTTLYTMVL